MGVFNAVVPVKGLRCCLNYGLVLSIFFNVIVLVSSDGPSFVGVDVFRAFVSCGRGLLFFGSKIFYYFGIFFILL